MSPDSREIVKSAQPPTTQEVWGTASLGSAAPAGGEEGAVKRAHRLLRGRYVMAAGLAAGCSVIGALLGLLSQKPVYRSEGLLEIRPVIKVPGERPEVVQGYQQYVLSQAALLQSDRVITMAVESPEWRAVGSRVGPDAIAEFADQLQADYLTGSTLVRVTYTDRSPQVAQAAVRAVIAAYKVIFLDGENEQRDRELQALNQKITKLNNEMATKRREMREAAKLDIESDSTRESLTVTPALRDAKQAQAAESENAFKRAKVEYETARGVWAYRQQLSATATTLPASVSDQELALVSPEMQLLLDRRQRTKLNHDLLAMSQGKDNPQVLRLEGELQVVDKNIQELRKTILKTLPSRATSPAAALTLSAVNELEIKMRNAEKQYVLDREVATAVASRMAIIENNQRDLQESQTELDRLNRELDRANMERQFTQKTLIHERGTLPLKPSRDRRGQFMALGLLGGGALPVIVLLLIGAMDQRYRYSDEAAAETSSVTLLGILPNLPDLLTNPDQAAIAAHCVHQIRTMLQINGTGRVFAITSASPGDGKTSLTLALGLSFAASGSRTLMIDCDLVGGGLSARLNVAAPEGVLEAIARRSLLQFVRTTDVTDLGILPVGPSHSRHAGVVSPAALRRLVLDARQHFDTILIDTGPVMGSIEAAAACAAADGVVLVVSRGQHRQAVEKTFARLRSIGARNAGVVFNRAQARDFEQSVSSLSMRRLVDQNGSSPEREEDGNGIKRLGPVVQAQQSSPGIQDTR